MSFIATTYRVLIASPSDLTEEREAATLAINDWNAQHAAAESIVLLPVKWETHARPESGVRPQGGINAQIVRTCDILVGMFWTKLGTSTGVAESGTVEEINQFVEQQKPALLYFSTRPIDPGKIDLKQHRKLKAFKDETYRQALVGSFSSANELRTTLLRDLMGQVRALPVSHESLPTQTLDEAQTVSGEPRSQPYSEIGPKVELLSRALIAKRFRPDLIVGLSRGGLVVAARLSHELKHQPPIPIISLWPHAHDYNNALNSFDLPKIYEMQRQSGLRSSRLWNVLIVDDACNSGRSLDYARRYVLDKLVSIRCRVQTAALEIQQGLHTTQIKPDFFASEEFRSKDAWGEEEEP
jgi:hypoxanthine phosphoribosyltransferase